MAQFDVYKVTGGAVVLDCQSNLLENLPTRFVVPLRETDRIVLKRLTPVFRIGDIEMTMLTPLARGIDVRDIKAKIATLTDHEYEINAALDMLISGF